MRPPFLWTGLLITSTIAGAGRAMSRATEQPREAGASGDVQPRDRLAWTTPSPTGSVASTWRSSATWLAPGPSSTRSRSAWSRWATPWARRPGGPSARRSATWPGATTSRGHRPGPRAGRRVRRRVPARPAAAGRGRALRRAGDGRGRELLDEAAERLERSGGLRAAAIARRDLGLIELDQGELVAALGHLGQAFTSLVGLDRSASGLALAGLASVAAQGRRDVAEQLAGGAGRAPRDRREPVCRGRPADRSAALPDRLRGGGRGDRRCRAARRWWPTSPRPPAADLGFYGDLPLRCIVRPGTAGPSS